MAYTVHTGYRLSISQAYATLYRWLQNNDYRLAGLPRVIDLQGTDNMKPDQYVVEVQLEVMR